MPPGDTLHVEIRVRPLSQREIKRGSMVTWRLEPDCLYEVVPSSGRRANEYTFDCVHNAEATTEDVYRSCARSIVAETVQGYNATIFVYGQTSSGKTFTMSGDDARPCGLVHLAARDIWSLTQASREWDFSLRVSYLEIYNEKERDLLDPTNTKLSLVQSVDGVVCVGLTTVNIASMDDIAALHAKGKLHRETGATDMNSTSSRSHAIFQIHLESRPKGCTADDRVRYSLLNLVDLAGSERHKDTRTEGQRKMEGSMINRSLLTLQKVIKALADCGGDRTKAPHIPLRESKLTRMLDNSIGGDARTLIICTVTPAHLHRAETLSVLQFAKLAKMIRNKPRINEKVSERMQLQQCQRNLETLQQQVLQLTCRNAQFKHEGPAGLEVLEELARLKVEVDFMNDLTSIYAQCKLDFATRQAKKRDASCMTTDAETLHFQGTADGHLVPTPPTKTRRLNEFRHSACSDSLGGAGAPAVENAAVHEDDQPVGSAADPPGVVQRLRLQLEEELRRCVEQKERAEHGMQAMLQQRLQFLTMLEQQKALLSQGIQADFEAARREQAAFDHKLRAILG